MTETTPQQDNPYLMSDDDFEALEEVLTSDIVPGDCMDLEMLDGFLAGVLISPRPIAVERWLPNVWSAHGEEASFGGGSGLQRAIRLVKAYLGEMVTTLGLDEEEEVCWEPFCFAIAEGDPLKIGEEWLEELRPGARPLAGRLGGGTRRRGGRGRARDARRSARAVGRGFRCRGRRRDAPRLAGGAGRDAVNDIYAHWRDIGLPAPQVLQADAPARPPPPAPVAATPAPAAAARSTRSAAVR